MSWETFGGMSLLVQVFCKPEQITLTSTIVDISSIFFFPSPSTILSRWICIYGEVHNWIMNQNLNKSWIWPTNSNFVYYSHKSIRTKSKILNQVYLRGKSITIKCSCALSCRCLVSLLFMMTGKKHFIHHFLKKMYVLIFGTSARFLLINLYIQLFQSFFP